MVLKQITTTRTNVGDESETVTRVTAEGALFEPERVLERTGNQQTPTMQPAVWNVPGLYDLDSDDLVIEGDPEAEGYDEATAPTWQVIGAGLHWLDRTKVPVERVASV